MRREWVFFVLVYLALVSAGCATFGNKESAKTSATEEAVPIVTPRLNEFVLGPQDRVKISVWRQQDLDREVVVSNAGMISFPLIGEMNVSNLTLTEFKTQLQQSLDQYLVNPHISVEVVSSRRRKIFVLGEINNPGVFPAESGLSMVQAISFAGGFTPDAKAETILRIRGDFSHPEMTILDMKAYLDGKNFEQDMSLQPGDVIYVPTTTIANVGRYFQHLSHIISPIVDLERGIFIAPATVDTLKGDGIHLDDKSGTSVILGR